jgi:methylaspartate mutase sigma subunit
MSVMKPDVAHTRATLPPLNGRSRGLHVVLAGASSDAHTWNLIFLQLLLTEHGHRVTNLGPCVPDDMLIEVTADQIPDLITVCSVNGGAVRDGVRFIRRARDHRRLAGVPIVIGGKLAAPTGSYEDAARDLLDAGYHAVFDDEGGVPAFRAYVGALAAQTWRGGR